MGASLPFTPHSGNEEARRLITVRHRHHQPGTAPLGVPRAAGAGAVRSGGVLVYSTCTISTAENEAQIDAFLHSHPGFILEDHRAVGAREAEGRRPGIVLTVPHRDQTAGFFIARMRRER